MQKTIELTEQAEADLIELWQYTAREWGVQQADVYYEQVTAKIRTLLFTDPVYAFHHELGAGIQSMPAEHHTVYFRVENDVISVVRVLGPGQNKFTQFQSI